MRYRRQTESLDDLVQVANLGLVKAIDGFDPERGRPFAAYAVPTILGELRRHFRDHVWNVRLPRGLQELTMQLDEATTALTEELGRFPTAAADRRAARDLGRGRARGAGGGPRPAHALARRAAARATRTRCRRSRRSATAELGYDRVEAQLASTAPGSTSASGEVLRMRFVEDLTQLEIGRRLGVSQMQVSRISRRALWKLLGRPGRTGRGAAAPRRASRRQ